MKLFKPGNGRAFTVLELMMVVVIIAVLLALWLPTIKRVDKRSPIIQCVNNLKQVGLSFRMWAGDNGDVYPMRYRTNDFDGPSLGNDKQMFIYFQSLSNELNTPKILICPADKKRTAASNFTSGFDGSRVSYFAGLDADESNPQMFLAGDRNMTNGTVAKNGVLEITTNNLPGWTERIHQFNGNVALADGSVQKVSTARLKNLLLSTGALTNRLVFP